MTAIAVITPEPGATRRVLVVNYSVGDAGELAYQRPDGRAGTFAAGVWQAVEEVAPEDVAEEAVDDVDDLVVEHEFGPRGGRP